MFAASVVKLFWLQLRILMDDAARLCMYFIDCSLSNFSLLCSLTAQQEESSNARKIKLIKTRYLRRGAAQQTGTALHAGNSYMIQL